MIYIYLSIYLYFNIHVLKHSRFNNGCQASTDQRYKLLVTAALAKPEVVGWSGIMATKISRRFFNNSKSPEL